MFKKVVLIGFVSVLFAGCASVPMESMEASNSAKSFSRPSEGHAGLFIYRTTGPGTALKKDIWVDGKCIGESAPNVFFYEEVAGNEEHTIATESEFSPNSLVVKTESGKHYFVEQYLKMGLFVGGADLKQVAPEQGKKDILDLSLAKKGTCSQ